MKKVKLTRGKFSLVDDNLFNYLNQWKWLFLSPGYAARTVRTKSGFRKILMHRLIMKTPKNTEVDHINQNKLDNRKSNLRNCTKTENLRNRPAPRTNTSGYKGVHWHKYNQKWVASISVNNEKICIGYFKSKKKAAMAYNKAARKYHKSFANLNQGKNHV